MDPSSGIATCFSDSPPGVPYRGSPTGGNVNAIAVFAVPTRLQGLSRLIESHHLSSKLLSRAERLTNTMMQGTDNEIRDAHRALVCRLPIRGYGVVEFDMTPDRINALVQGGRTATELYLRNRDAGTLPAR